MSDYYETLGVPRDATFKEIKAAYRSLMQKYHPDKEEGNKDKAQAIQEAYDVLSDSDARAHYDATGTTEPVRDIEAEIQAELMKVFSHLLEKNEDTDIIADAKDRVKVAIKNYQIKINQNTQLLDRLQRQLGRIKTSDEENLYEMVVASKIEQVEEYLSSLAEALDLVQRVLEAVDHYTDTGYRTATSRSHGNHGSLSRLIPGGFTGTQTGRFPPE